MEIKVELEKQPVKYLNKCDSKTYNKLMDALEGLKKLDGDIKHLQGTQTYRLKVKSYRILFTRDIKDSKSKEKIQVLAVYRIGPRGDVYKKGGFR